MSSRESSGTGTPCSAGRVLCSDASRSFYSETASAVPPVLPVEVGVSSVVFSSPGYSSGGPTGVVTVQRATSAVRSAAYLPVAAASPPPVSSRPVSATSPSRPSGVVASTSPLASSDVEWSATTSSCKVGIPAVSTWDTAGYTSSSTPVSFKPATLTSKDLLADPGLSAYIEDEPVPSSRVATAGWQSEHEDSIKSTNVPVGAEFSTSGTGVPPLWWFPLEPGQYGVSPSDHAYMRPRGTPVVDTRGHPSTVGVLTSRDLSIPPGLVREVRPSVGTNQTTVSSLSPAGVHRVPPGFAGMSVAGLAPPRGQTRFSGSTGGCQLTQYLPIY